MGLRKPPRTLKAQFKHYTKKKLKNIVLGNKEQKFCFGPLNTPGTISRVLRKQPGGYKVSPFARVRKYVIPLTISIDLPLHRGSPLDIMEHSGLVDSIMCIQHSGPKQDMNDRYTH